MILIEHIQFQKIGIFMPSMKYFFNFKGNLIAQNWTWAGFSYKLNKAVKFKAGYFYQKLPNFGFNKLQLGIIEYVLLRSYLNQLTVDFISFISIKRCSNRKRCLSLKSPKLWFRLRCSFNLNSVNKLNGFWYSVSALV